VVAIRPFVILFVLVFLLTSSKGGIFKHNERAHLHGRCAGLTDGTAVRLNGITIGVPRGDQADRSRDPKRPWSSTCWSSPKSIWRHIPVDSVVGITAANLLGEQIHRHHQGQSPTP
jgi:ABC-type transporter Mla subunit MlaD